MLSDEEFRVLTGIADVNHRIKGNMRHLGTAQMAKQCTLADLASSGHQQNGKNFFIAKNFGL